MSKRGRLVELGVLQDHKHGDHSYIIFGVAVYLPDLLEVSTLVITFLKKSDRTNGAARTRTHAGASFHH